MATRALSCVRMSEFADNFLALVCPAEYDVLLVCSRKIEAVMAMRDAKRAASGAAISGDKAAALELLPLTGRERPPRRSRGAAAAAAK